MGNLDVYVPATKEGARPTTVEVDNGIEGFRKLRDLARKAKFRQTLMDSRTAMICRLETEIDQEMRAMIKEQVKHLDKLIDKAEKSPDTKVSLKWVDRRRGQR